MVNLEAEAKRFTNRRCKVLRQCQFLKRGGGGGEGMGEGMGHLPNKGCAASAKSRPGKNHKISVQMMLSIRIDKSM